MTNSVEDQRSPDLELDRTLDGAVGLRGRYATYLLLSAVVLALTAALLPSSAHHFARFFGGANPLVVVAATSVIGGAALVFLQSRGGFAVLRGRRTLRGIGLSAALAALPALAAVVADLLLGYPEDMNVPVPPALLFYPAVGFAAEVAFHLVPLGLLLLVMTPLVRLIGLTRVIWLGMLLTAFVEPTFQALLARGSSPSLVAYTWTHVSAISLLELYVFRRFDFVSMYTFRLCYYALWHVLWGSIRLDVLFD